MATERNVVDFKIHNLTEEQFQELKAQGKIDPNAVYCTPDESLKKNQITNCITEIPQDIKVEISDGQFVIKAGSRVYMPNGSGVFDTIVIPNDIKVSGWTNLQGMVFVSYNGLTGFFTGIAQIQSGSSGTISGGNVWYDTTTNKIFRSSGSAWDTQVSFPICFVSCSNGDITSIDQVFNGFGYVGSTVFVLPGVCALAPDGRNKDGTLRNIELKTTNVSVYRTASSSQTEVSLSLTAQNNQVAVSRYGGGFEVVESLPETGVAWRRYYIPSENYIYVFTDSTTVVKQYAVDMYAGTFTVQTSAPFNVTALNPKMAFRAVDYNDFESTVEEINNSISAVDSSAVHKTGNETISGTKTFESTIHMQKTGLSVYNNSVTKGTNPTAAQYWAGILWNDKTDAATSWQNSRLGYLEMSLNTAGEAKLSMGAYKNEADSTANATIAVGYSTSGAWASAPTPASTSNGTNIATTAWVRDLFEALYPVGSLYISTGNSCPLTSIVKKSDGSNSTWTLVAAGKALWTGNGTTGDGTVRNTPTTGANNTISAGLPDITGEFVAANSNAPAGSGAFTVKSTGDGKGWDGTAAMRSTYSFDATRSSSIYGNSTTVQPPAYVVNVWRRTA